ncbi:glycerol 2-dehydrogenase (NADP(+)) [Trichomonascus vanleenenianus]|uniref:glycerol 2-dehydrogenase (NADP(+)) n=1 Tax=Trichomonascus vanleenenianus TaxID=2268995 RepID=UPI003ECB4B85
MTVVPPKSSSAQLRSTLNNGTVIPTVGVRAELTRDTDVYKTILDALKNGFRHIDAAWMYGNEPDVGRAIKDSGVPREEIFLSTKLWSTHHKNPQAALDESLKNLQTDYVDLYIMHWPVALNPKDNAIIPRKEDGTRDVDTEWSYVKTWELMQQIPKAKARSIGVANCSSVHLEQILKAPTTTTKPAVNQVEVHPFLAQCHLTDYCKLKNITIEAYCPSSTALMSLLGHPVLVQLSKKYNVSRTCVLESWLLQRGYVVLSKDPVPNAEKYLKLSNQEIEQVRTISRSSHHRILQPDWGVEVFHDDKQ